MDTEPQRHLKRSLESVLASGKYSDFIISCGGKEYHVHKAIICPQSTFFEAVFAHEMEESRTGVVRLDDDDPKAVSSMIRFFYTLDYPCESTSTGSDDNKEQQGSPGLVHHSRVYAIADKYTIEPLKKLSLGKFRKACTQSWKHDEFAEAAHEVYETTPETDRGLRNIVVNTIDKNRSLLDKGEVKTAVKESQLAFDLVEKCVAGCSNVVKAQYVTAWPGQSEKWA